MALRVNTNVDAIGIHNSLVDTSKKVSDSLKRLSTGLRVNSAKDDASGLAIANRFKSQASSMRVAYQNSAEAQSMLQTADGAYNKIHDLLMRMKDLATQAASGQSSQSQLDSEFQFLKSEIDRIAGATNYNGTALVSSGGTSMTFQVGAANSVNDRITLTLSSATLSSLGVNANDLSSVGGAQSAMDNLDTALGSVNNYMAKVGAYQNRLQYTMENLAVSIENFTASESAIRDVDMAYEMTQFTKNQILQQSGIAMLSQANQATQQIMQLIGQ